MRLAADASASSSGTGFDSFIIIKKCDEMKGSVVESEGGRERRTYGALVYGVDYLSEYAERLVDGGGLCHSGGVVACHLDGTIVTQLVWT